MVLDDHPNVLKSHCSFVSDHNLWVIMPCMAGGSCLHILKVAHPDGFEETVIATVLREVLKGLEYLHHHGFIYCDVKGIAKLQPFGRACCIYLGDEGSANIHPNLVNLHGCCIEGTELLLVYEYLENNSLARALFNSEKIQLILDWPTRVKICVGITKGLAYLHEESSLRIVHRDIKATNVLLDRDLNPKISDFRLARLTGDDNTHISTRVAGTIGYMSPEYALWGYLTYKADVYSFGIEKARGVISSPSHHPNTSINKPSVVTPIVPPTTANVDDVDPLVSDDDRSPSPIH